MLANLLPGLREVRAPLVAGYILLVAGFMVWAHYSVVASPEAADTPPGADAAALEAGSGDSSTDEEEDALGGYIDENFAELGVLLDAVGSVGLVTAVSVMAYIVGSVGFSLVPERFTRRDLEEFLHGATSEDVAYSIALLEEKRPEVIEERNRLLAEAQVREAVAVPGTLLVGVVLLLTELYWWGYLVAVAGWAVFALLLLRDSYLLRGRAANRVEVVMRNSEIAREVEERRAAESESTEGE